MRIPWMQSKTGSVNNLYRTRSYKSNLHRTESVNNDHRTGSVNNCQQVSTIDIGQEVSIIDTGQKVLKQCHRKRSAFGYTYFWEDL